MVCYGCYAKHDTKLRYVTKRYKNQKCNAIVFANVQKRTKIKFSYVRSLCMTSKNMKGTIHEYRRLYRKGQTIYEY